MFHRTELLVGKEAFEIIKSVKIILFGAGGVGSWCAEALVRTGFQKLVIVDSDLICPTNINRQLQALADNIGKPKTEELRKRLLLINPEAEIIAEKVFYEEETSGRFDLKEYDYALDAIDTLKNKTLLLKNCAESGVTVFSSMGAGAKIDSAQIRTAPLSKTKQCPLARMVRKRLGQAGIKGKFLCVYSEEPPMENKGATFCGAANCACPDKDERNLCKSKARINGTLAHVTAAFGFALAGLVVQDIMGKIGAAN